MCHRGLTWDIRGLLVLLGFGLVFAAGPDDANLATTQGLTIGNNIPDFAPSIALTYTSPPMIAEGIRGQRQTLLGTTI